MNQPSDVGTNRRAVAGFVCALLAVLAVVVAFWLWLPSIILGATAVGLGLEGRKGAAAGSVTRDLAVSAVALGVVAILMTPAVNQIASGERDYGGKCALNPELPEC